MPLVYFLLISGAVGIVLYQPRDIIFVPAGGSVDISCISNTTSGLSDMAKNFWYRKTWKDGDMLTRFASCVTVSPQTNPCRQDTNGFTIKLFNIQPEDSGMYYCSHFYLHSLIFANGTTLIITGDNSDGINIGYFLITPQQPTPNSAIQLACIVSALHTGHVTWNISGTRHMGRRTSAKLLNGTWIILNLLSLPRDTWHYGDNVTCEVWFSSSPVQIHWKIPHIGKKSKWFGSCYSWLCSLLILALLLIGVTYVHLAWMKRRSVNASQRLTLSRRMDFKDEGEIVYTELNLYMLSKNQE